MVAMYTHGTPHPTPAPQPALSQVAPKICQYPFTLYERSIVDMLNRAVRERLYCNPCLYSLFTISPQDLFYLPSMVHCRGLQVK